MNKNLLLTALVLTITASAAGMMLSCTAKAFVPRAAMGNQFETGAVKLATSMSMSSEVESYARKMITDHNELGTSVKAAVMKTDPSSVSPTQQKMLGTLRAAGENSGALYKKDMDASHGETYALFQKDARVPDADTELKTGIRSALPGVKMHWDMARKLPAMSM